MICLNVRLTVKPGTEAEAVRMFALLAAESRNEPGCLMYIAHQHKNVPTRFLVYEQYRDEAALDSHRDSSHFKKYATDGIYRHVTEREAELYRAL